MLEKNSKLSFPIDQVDRDSEKIILAQGMLNPFKDNQRNRKSPSLSREEVWSGLESSLQPYFFY